MKSGGKNMKGTIYGNRLPRGTQVKNVGNHCPRQWLSIYRAVNHPCFMKNDTKYKLYNSGTLANKVLACIRGFASYILKGVQGKAYRVYSVG
jgi:hypothetical protein